MRKVLTTIGIIATSFLFFSTPVFAQTTNPDILEYTNNTLQIITLISTAAAVFFLVKAGYLYITSSGKPEALESAKNTIRNAIIGLTLVLAANIVTSVFQHALNSQTTSGTGTPIDVVSIETAEPSEGLTQVLIDAIGSFIQNIVESSTEPIVNGVLGYLTTTPTLLDNEVVRNFWFVTVGIVDALFVLVVALMGLQVMSASTFGFEEVEIKQLLPRLGLSFLAANISLFLADYAIITCNALVEAILDSTGGLNHAWIQAAFNPTAVISGTTPLIILIFMVMFLVVSIVLLLMYISRLIIISLGAVLSPFIFLLSALPKFSDLASIAIKTYLVSVFIVFVHVVIIQLASSFLTLPEHSENSLISIAVGIGLFITLLKTPNLMMQMVMYTANSGSLKKLGNQIINVMTTDNASVASRAQAQDSASKLSRKAIKL
ncbi:MAG: hypothetical protein GW762_05805 [Candidatus Pacebacteria bacterium]|nr:hypothetical protein [Candidatus Paceibacterota bacterium]PIR63226.1 MAG: hypothetical protein COU64_05920 [Candidatus Pacebacteria bacterium CG10_big_fil_rev_8_21_14_0_10_40_26]PIZ78256.1 MAG: hypothetical protein COY01_05740 [Candidatus Pacebacteria bacterium CG_4_10_14_0_2_um_filter_40_20]PJA68699.1 MAG: hypothetical protein CO156_04305 [Candidatus Pacebacteria bacterium CG_4_9_14_3_um_filter_40_12]PJC41639.1 MAG: hypothetical protein CO041_02895 [Candidatus Pacebacteria bacterium CG_4_9_